MDLAGFIIWVSIIWVSATQMDNMENSKLIRNISFFIFCLMFGPMGIIIYLLILWDDRKNK